MLSSFREALASGDLQNVITTTLGQVIIALAAIILLLLAVSSKSRNKTQISVKTLTYSALAIAAATVLSQIKLFAMPQGGTVTPFSMLFIIVIGYFFGVRSGVIVGAVYGLFQLLIGGWVMHPIQLLLDYPIAFAALGLSGLFTNQENGLLKGVIVGCLGRFVAHFLSGIIFFASYAPEGWNPWVYSAWYNISYIGVEGVATAIIVAVPAVAAAFRTVKKSAMAR